MKVLTLFRLVCGSRWRPIDSVVWPILELGGLYLQAAPLMEPAARTVGGVTQISLNLMATVLGTVARRWVSRNQDVLAGYFNRTRRRVTALELFLGVLYFLFFLDLLLQNMVLCSGPDVFRCLAGTLLAFYVSAFRFLWIYFIFALLLADVDFHLRRVPVRGELEDYKWSCGLLQSTNLLLNEVLDWFLLLSALASVNLGSLATYSKCNAPENLMSWGLLLLAPNIVLAFIGERIGAAMYEKRIRIRKRWIGETDTNSELYAVLGHGNAQGIKWMANSEFVNFPSTLSVFTNVVSYAGLILTTPLLVDSGFQDFFC